MRAETNVAGVEMTWEQFRTRVVPRPVCPHCLPGKPLPKSAPNGSLALGEGHMDLRFTPEEIAFRDEVCAAHCLARNVPEW